MCWNPLRHLPLSIMWALMVLVLWSPFAHATGEMSPADLLAERASALSEGTDGATRLRYTIRVPGKKDRTVQYAMLWQNTPDHPKLRGKALLFPELPPSLKGIGYMGWFRRDGGPADEWLYLPKMRVVRKLTKHKHHHGHHKKGDAAAEEYGDVIFGHQDLILRDASLDHHKLLGIKPVGDVITQVLESTPIKARMNFPYRKVVRFIDPRNAHTLRMELYNEGPQPVRRITFEWETIDGIDVWRKVTGQELLTPENDQPTTGKATGIGQMITSVTGIPLPPSEEVTGGRETVLELEHLVLNPGLKERLFTKRGLTSGPGRYFK